VFILGGRKRLQDYYSSRLIESRDGRWRYQLTARRTGAPFPRVILTLAGTPLFIEEMVLHEDGGSVYTYRFSDIRFDPRLPGDLFEFRPPPGVEIVRME
jgi:outer membrane lipoprotein-sorting protein